MQEEHTLKIVDDSFLYDVIEGLSETPKTLPCKYFYDARGSALFDEICELPEYYPTRTELKIMTDNASLVSSQLGKGVRLVEFGSGSSIKTRILLDNLYEPAAYIPVDISEEHLNRSASTLSEIYPNLTVLPICADFTEKLEIPDINDAETTVIYFPGSTIGNFEKDEAKTLLGQCRQLCADGGGLLIGIDLVKDQKVLENAYNDSRGITAEFNLNILDRINRELGADFSTDRFAHRAHWNKKDNRVEMHLVSKCQQTVNVDGHTLEFTKDETIHTESSHKYTVESFNKIAAFSGFRCKHTWLDENNWFSVQLLEAV